MDLTVNPRPQANGLGHLPFGELAAHQRVRALIAGCLQDTNSICWNPSPTTRRRPPAPADRSATP
jgi:hypothetical protein